MVRRSPTQHRDAIEHVTELFGGGDSLQLALRELQCQIEVAPMPDVDDGGRGTLADQQPADGFDRTLGGGESDTHRAALAQRFEALQAEGQMRTTLVARHRVDLVHDDGLHRAQRLASARASQQQVQGFGRGHHQVGVAFEQLRPLAGRAVAGAHRDAHGRGLQAELVGHRGNLG